MKTIVFPKKLDTENQPVMRFRAINLQIENKRELESIVRKFTDAEIVLPISSSGMSDTISTNWEETDLINANLKETALKQMIKAFKDSVGGTISKHIESKNRQTINDFAGLYFNDMNFREFTFNWSFIPNNLQEAELLREIILMFKYFSTAKQVDQFVYYPSMWDIKVNFPNNIKYFTFQNCVNTNIETNYFPDDIPSIFISGHPMKIDFTMGFKELSRPSREDFDPDKMGKEER